jgi:chromate transport protein ChrA
VQLDSAIDAELARTASVMTAGGVATLNLYRVARPLNVLRATLVVAMAVCTALFFVLPFTRHWFDLPVVDAWVYGVAAGAIAVSFPLLIIGGRLGAHVAERLADRERTTVAT